MELRARNAHAAKTHPRRSDSAANTSAPTATVFTVVVSSQDLDGLITSSSS